MEKIMYKFGQKIRVPGFKPTKPFDTGYVMGSDLSMKKNKGFNNSKAKLKDKDLIKNDKSLKERFLNVLK